MLAAHRAAADARAALAYGTTRYRADESGIRWFTEDEVAAARLEVAPVLELYDEALRPAGSDFTQALIVMLSAAYPPSKGTDEDAELKLQIYAEALQDYPADLLADAARQQIRQSRFFPTVAELIRSGNPNGLEWRYDSRISARNWLAGRLGIALLPKAIISRSIAEDAAEYVWGKDGRCLP